jgi:hypothetical protein
MLALEQYPKTIAEIQRLILDFDKQIRQTAETLALIDNQIDLKIVNDPNLKNDGQRKAQRDNLRQTDPFRLKAIDLLNRLTDRRAAQEIDLEYYRLELKIRLLDKREQLIKSERETIDYDEYQYLATGTEQRW